MNMTSITETATDSGAALINALCEAGAYDHQVDSVNLIETHISWVLLTGQYAYKIKKPVNFGFLDFSTLEKRLFFCREELRLNRRLAADLYLEVVPITGTVDKPKMGGQGDAIEYAVKMLQFPTGCTLDERAQHGQLAVDAIDQLTDIIADFHEAIAKAGVDSPYGDSENIRHWCIENFDHIRPLLNDDRHKQQLQLLEAWHHNEWCKQAELMQRRKQQGAVRECHGDLHLGNITLINGRVTPFDCIEFNPMLRWVDVVSEAAFLILDLIRFGQKAYAYRFLNRYLQCTGDYQGLALLPYYLVYRAMVRAKVSLLRNSQQHNDACIDYGLYADLAERFTKSREVALIITHGYSGSGKSTFAAGLAEYIGAIQIRSDVERKRLFGYRSQDSSGSAVNDGLYTQNAGELTYRHLAVLAKGVLEAGFPVIIDAAFLKKERRDLFRQLAIKQGVAFFIIDFHASDETLARRIHQRQHDASEATVEVLQQQQRSAEPLSDQEQTDLITVDTEDDNALEKLLNRFATYR